MAHKDMCSCSACMKRNYDLRVKFVEEAKETRDSLSNRIAFDVEAIVRENAQDFESNRMEMVDTWTFDPDYGSALNYAIRHCTHDSIDQVSFSTWECFLCHKQFDREAVMERMHRRGPFFF